MLTQLTKLASNMHHASAGVMGKPPVFASALDATAGPASEFQRTSVARFVPSKATNAEQPQA